MTDLERKVVELKRNGANFNAIAATLNITYDQARHAWRRVLARTRESAQMELPVRPVKVVLPKRRETAHEAGQPYTAVHFGDQHFPFADPRALSILYQVVEDINPHLLTALGDGLDAFSVSTYEKDLAHRVSLQEEIDAYAAHLGTLAALAPHAELWAFRGNHEYRLQRELARMGEKVSHREVLLLEKVRATLEWPVLLDLKTLGWQWHEDKRILFNRLILKHGDFVSKHSAYSARAEMDRYAKSGMSGHTHRMGVYERRDWNGRHAWWEVGCLCDLNPKYVSDPNWQQGFLVSTWSDDRKTFGVEEVRIHEGKAWFRGKRYVG